MWTVILVYLLTDSFLCFDEEQIHGYPLADTEFFPHIFLIQFPTSFLRTSLSNCSRVAKYNFLPL